jgi:hypothetical protein
MLLVMRHGIDRRESPTPLTVLPQPEHKDGVVRIDLGTVWPREVVHRFNWKLAKLSAVLVAAESKVVLEGFLHAAV